MRKDYRNGYFIQIEKEKAIEKEKSKFIKEITPKLTDLEIAKAEVFIDLHKCPWYKNFFDKLPKYTLRQGSSGIGIWNEIKCEHCGKTYDITDYGCW